MMLKSTIFLFCFFSCFLGRLDCAENKQTNANHGDNVTLTCYSPRDVVVLMLRWKKQDEQRYVLFITENRPYENLQDPTFKGRVELKDPEMKNGELSVILKNVTVKDNGVYECYAGYNNQEPQLLNSITLTVDPPDNKQRNVNHGDNVTLTCYSPRDVVVLILKWKKQDEQRYVLFIRENRSYENLQDPSFKGRVELKDPEMKNGELSVILKNVTVKDNGVYECYAGYNNQEPQLLNNITLTVYPAGQAGGQSGDGGKEDEGEKSGPVGLIAGLSVFAVLLVVAVVGFVIYRKYGNSKYQYPSEQGQQMEMSS